MSDNQKARVDEEDDLDELDDVLDQFSGPSSESKLKSPAAQPAPAPAVASTSTADAEDETLGAEFAKQMDSFLKSLRSNTGASEGNGEATDRELAAAWEAALAEAGPSNGQTPAETSAAGSKQDDFQSRIRSTMNKLKESESGLKSSDSSANLGGDASDFESMLSQLGSLSGDSDGAESEEQLQQMLEEMMGQLMGKEVLYEPLKELDEKFPEYLSKNSSTISPKDKGRFEAQRSCIKRLLVEFEAPKYSDDDAEIRKKVVDLMGELQSHGSPPEEIMGPLPPGFNMATDGLPDMPEECKVN